MMAEVVVLAQDFVFETSRSPHKQHHKDKRLEDILPGCSELLCICSGMILPYSALHNGASQEIIVTLAIYTGV